MGGCSNTEKSTCKFLGGYELSVREKLKNGLSELKVCIINLGAQITNR